MQAKHIRAAGATALLAGLASAAQAHDGHGPHELWDIFTHAFGAEQLLVLAGLVVGVIAIRRWRAGRQDRRLK